MNDHTKLANLHRFTGSEKWYKHGLNKKVLFTEGAKYVADEAGAYWLLDLIAIAQCCESRVAQEGFQVWTLIVHPERQTMPRIEAAIVNCDDGDGNEIYSQSIEYTDFPLPKIVLWFVDNTILLPSEY